MFRSKDFSFDNKLLILRSSYSEIILKENKASFDLISEQMYTSAIQAFSRSSIRTTDLICGMNLWISLYFIKRNSNENVYLNLFLFLRIITYY